ncbi:MAG: HD domain-containing protein [Treponema sp.]|jgi:HD-GYP domain-containing protein (c-di-GMP phosphodiesterase class II)|nr:HD domain-containing protein [Treponema sp.]
MRKVLVKNLKEGAVFSEPVYIDGDNLLVPAGIAIRKKDLSRLASWGIEAVETEGVQLTQEEIDALAKSAEEAKNAKKGKSKSGEKAAHKTSQDTDPSGAQENSEAYQTYMELIDRLHEVCDNISSGVAVEARSIDNITGRLLQAVREQRHSFIGFILGGETKRLEMAKNLVNTAILSAMIALELKMPNHKVLQIVTGALLHDVGMLRMPKEIVEKKGSLSPAEVQRIQSHTLYTYKIVNKELLYPEDVGLIVLQHHERWDGEGYPRRLVGQAIDLGARIVSVADAFEAMVSHKPYRNSMMGYQAMKNLLSDNLRRFDPDVIKAFIQTMGIYPIGSIVLLNNGAMAKVVDVQPTAPLRPSIRIIADEFGKVFKQDEGELVDLLVEKSLFIAKAVDPRELAAKNAK